MVAIESLVDIDILIKKRRPRTDPYCDAHRDELTYPKLNASPTGFREVQVFAVGKVHAEKINVTDTGICSKSQ